MRLGRSASAPSCSWRKLLVGLEVALEPAHLRVALEREHVRGDAVQKPPVVRHHDGTARKREQRLLQRPQRVDVEVVGRLVEQQQVASGPQQLGQVQAVSFAARQLGDLLLLLGAPEVEPGDIRAAVDHAVAERYLLDAARDLLPDGLVRVQRVAGLVHVCELDGVAERKRARVGLVLTGDHPQAASSCRRRLGRSHRRCRPWAA